MSKFLSLLLPSMLVATLLPASVASAPIGEGGGGGGAGGCNYCKYNALGGTYSCPASDFFGRQGGCRITLHMGVFICRAPAGPSCVSGNPLPTDPGIF